MTDSEQGSRGRRAGRVAAWLVAGGVLLLTGALGIYNGIDEWGNRTNAFQTSITAGVFVYGVLGLIGLAGMILRRRWAVPVVAAWGITVTYVAAFTALAYAPKDASLVGTLAAGTSTAAISLLVLWSVWTRVRPAATPRNSG